MRLFYNMIKISLLLLSSVLAISFVSHHDVAYAASDLSNIEAPKILSSATYNGVLIQGEEANKRFIKVTEAPGDETVGRVALDFPELSPETLKIVNTGYKNDQYDIQYADVFADKEDVPDWLKEQYGKLVVGEAFSNIGTNGVRHSGTTFRYLVKNDNNEWFLYSAKASEYSRTNTKVDIINADNDEIIDTVDIGFQRTIYDFSNIEFPEEYGELLGYTLDKDSNEYLSNKDLDHGAFRENPDYGKDAKQDELYKNQNGYIYAHFKRVDSNETEQNNDNTQSNVEDESYSSGTSPQLDGADNAINTKNELNNQNDNKSSDDVKSIADNITQRLPQTGDLPAIIISGVTSLIVIFMLLAVIIRRKNN